MTMRCQPGATVLHSTPIHFATSTSHCPLPFPAFDFPHP